MKLVVYLCKLCLLIKPRKDCTCCTARRGGISGDDGFSCMCLYKIGRVAALHRFDTSDVVFNTFLSDDVRLSLGSHNRASCEAEGGALSRCWKTCTSSSLGRSAIVR